MTSKNLALIILIGAAFVLIIWQNRPATWSGVQILGLCLTIFGFIMWSLARLQLGRSFSVTAQAKKLVTSGIYSKIRNPIYVFGTFIIAGVILMIGRPIWLLILLLLIPLQIWRAGIEAKVLEAKFGEEYRQYRAKTWF